MYKILKLLVPVLTGILVVLGIFKTDELIRDMATSNYSLNTTDMANVLFYYLIIPIAFLFSIIIQWLVIQPLIKKLEKNYTIMRLKLIHFVILISALLSGVVGYIFWRKTLLWDDAVIAYATSFILLFIYFIISALVTKGLTKFQTESKHFDVEQKTEINNPHNNHIN
jgi:hypothetical protein